MFPFWSQSLFTTCWLRQHMDRQSKWIIPLHWQENHLTKKCRTLNFKLIVSPGTLTFICWFSCDLPLRLSLSFPRSLSGTDTQAVRMTDERNTRVVRSYSLHTSVSEPVFRGRETEKDKTGETWWKWQRWREYENEGGGGSLENTTMEEAKRKQQGYVKMPLKLNLVQNQSKKRKRRRRNSESRERRYPFKELLSEVLHYSVASVCLSVALLDHLPRHLGKFMLLPSLWVCSSYETRTAAIPHLWPGTGQRNDFFMKRKNETRGQLGIFWYAMENVPMPFCFLSQKFTLRMPAFLSKPVPA